MTLATHRTLEFIVGVAMIFAPAFVIVSREANMDAPSVLVPGLFSLVIITAGVAGRRDRGSSSERGGHLAFDRIITALLLLAGAILFVTDEEVGAVICLAACIAEGLLLLTTDYARATDDEDTALGTTTVTDEPTAD